MARSSAVVVGVILVTLLTGCAADARPDAASERAPQPSATAPAEAPSASADPRPVSPDAQSAAGEVVDEIPLDEYDEEPSTPVASYISANTSALTVGPVNGSAAVSFDYFTSDVDEVIAALTTAFGFEPTLNTNLNEYRWYGFALYTAHLPGDYPELPRFYVWVESGTVGDVPVLIGGAGQVGRPLSLLSGHYLETGYGFVEAYPVNVDLALISDPGYGAVDPYNATLVWFTSTGAVKSWTTPERRY